MRLATDVNTRCLYLLPSPATSWMVACKQPTAAGNYIIQQGERTAGLHYLDQFLISILHTPVRGPHNLQAYKLLAEKMQPLRNGLLAVANKPQTANILICSFSFEPRAKKKRKEPCVPATYDGWACGAVVLDEGFAW